MGAGPPTAAGRDLPGPRRRRAGLLPRGGGRGAGSWRLRSCSLSTCRGQTARARPSPAPLLRLQPRRGRRSPSRARARAQPLPEPCPSPSPPPGGAAPLQEPQVRVLAGGASSAGKGEVPALQSFLGNGRSPLPRACASCTLPDAWLPPRRPPPCALFAPPAPGDPRPPLVLVSPVPEGDKSADSLRACFS